LFLDLGLFQRLKFLRQKTEQKQYIVTLSTNSAQLMLSFFYLRVGSGEWRAMVVSDAWLK